MISQRESVGEGVWEWMGLTRARFANKMTIGGSTFEDISAHSWQRDWSNAETDKFMLDWNEKFETGHSLIDTQHRMLISYINRLEEMSGNSNPSRGDIELFSRFVQFLEDYILMHFGEEEECMVRFRCPAHKDNKRAHTEFLDFFQGFKLRFGIEGYSAEVVKELFEACVAWIQRHILRIDVQLKPCQTPFYGLDEPE